MFGQRFGLKGVAVSLVTTDEIKHVQEARYGSSQSSKMHFWHTFGTLAR